jgi:hypothetical protein
MDGAESGLVFIDGRAEEFQKFARMGRAGYKANVDCRISRVGLNLPEFEDEFKGVMADLYEIEIGCGSGLKFFPAGITHGGRRIGWRPRVAKARWREARWR